MRSIEEVVNELDESMKLIDEKENIQDWRFKGVYIEDALNEIIEIHKSEQRPKGHWVLTDDDFVYCSVCEDSYYPRPIDPSWKYCPNCGSCNNEEEYVNE